MIKNVELRRAEQGDLPRLVELSQQLGYLNTVDELTGRFHELNGSSEHRLIVSVGRPGDGFETNQMVVGLLYLKLHKTLFVEPGLEVGGIVVDQRFRGCGIGRLMMDHAERVAKEWKLNYVRLSSNIKRAEAHLFYEAIGYERTKTSYFFKKPIN